MTMFDGDEKSIRRFLAREYAADDQAREEAKKFVDKKCDFLDVEI